MAAAVHALTALLLLAPSATVPAPNSLPAHAPLPVNYGAIMERWRANLVAITYTLEARQTRDGGDVQKVEEALCGIIVTSDGLIVTSADPFPDQRSDPEKALFPIDFRVHRAGQRALEAEAIGLDRDLNLAWLRLKSPPSGIETVLFAEGRPLQIGDSVVLLGVLPQTYGYAPVPYPALVNAVIDQPRRMYSLDTPVQDLAIGGLLVHHSGEPVGILGEDLLKTPVGRARAPGNALSLVGSLTQGPKVGYPMVFPAALFAEQIAAPPAIDSGSQHSWLGVVMQPLSEALIDYWKLDVPGGIIVSSVIEGSPAEKAGLQEADILVGLSGAPIPITSDEHLPDFRRLIERAGAGNTVELSYLRQGKRDVLQVRLGEAPRTAEMADQVEDDVLGLTVRELTLEDKQGQNLDVTTRGVVVAELDPGGWAHLGGVQPDDIVKSVHGTPVVDLASFQEALNRLNADAPEETLFFVQRQTETLFIRVRAQRHPERQPATP